MYVSCSLRLRYVAVGVFGRTNLPIGGVVAEAGLRNHDVRWFDLQSGRWRTVLRLSADSVSRFLFCRRGCAISSLDNMPIRLSRSPSLCASLPNILPPFWLPRQCALCYAPRQDGFSTISYKNVLCQTCAEFINIINGRTHPL